MGKQAIFLIIVMLVINSTLFASEQVHITFDPPLIPGGVKPLNNWIEQDINFSGPNGFSQYDSGEPFNGTAYLKFAAGPAQTLVFQPIDSKPFQLISVDLAEYSTNFATPKKITFVGHKTNGAIVTGDFTTDGIIDGTGPLQDFETFTFGQEFSNLSYVEIPTTTYSMDNVILIFQSDSNILTELEITGPQEIVEGSPVQYNSIVTYTNGFRLNVTTAATWSVEPQILGEIDGNGVLRTENINEPTNIILHSQYTEGSDTLETEITINVLPSLILQVPSEYNTIQEAINVARSGDTVLIAPGIFTGDGNRDIDFRGKGITVQSQNPSDLNIVAATIIDCNGTEAQPHRGFFFHNSECPNSILNGLTIVNGYAPNFPYQQDSHTYNYWAGGAIFCYESSPTISNCRLIGNYASWCGGAINGWQSNAIITGCLIANNSVASGGGIYCRGGTMTITNCVITENTALGGGGIGCNGDSSIINNCLIIGNIARTGGGITAGGDNFNPCRLRIINCTFLGNKATKSGGAIYCGELSSPSVVNSILWGDSAINGSEIVMSNIDWGSSLSISYSNLQGGKAGILNGSYRNCRLNWGIGNIDTDPCFVEPGYWDSNGTLDDVNDDFWVDGDYHLKSEGWRWGAVANQWTWDNVTSRCIDAGNPGYYLGDEPITLLVDPLNRFGVNKRIDMGAYGGTAEASMPPYGWALLSDMDNSGDVDFADYSYLAQFYGSSGEKLDDDLNRDGKVDFADISLIADDWLKSTDWAED